MYKTKLSIALALYQRFPDIFSKLDALDPLHPKLVLLNWPSCWCEILTVEAGWRLQVQGIGGKQICQLGALDAVLAHFEILLQQRDCDDRP